MATTLITIGNAFRAGSSADVYYLDPVNGEIFLQTVTVNRAGVLIVEVPYANGEKFHFVGIDNNGRYSERNFTIADRTPPDAPTDLVINEDGTELVGKAQPGSEVKAKTPTGEVLGTTTADDDGNFTITLSPPQTDGEKVNVTARDPGGLSDISQATAPDLTPPKITRFDIEAAPDGAEGNPFMLQTTEPGSYVTITDAEGNVVFSGRAGADGRVSGTLLGGPYARGEKFTAIARDQADNDSLPYEAAAPDLPICFAAGSLIETASGPRRVEELAVGDLVRTKDNGLQPVLWIGRAAVTPERIARSAQLRPVRIKAGALGNGLPAQDLLVSQQHRILISSRITGRMFDCREVLVAAKHLVGTEGIEIAADVEHVEYVHFLTGQHDLVYANGVEAETLYLGAMARNSLSPEAREEIERLFPELAAVGAEAARPLVPGRKAQSLARRHRANSQPLVS